MKDKTLDLVSVRDDNPNIRTREPWKKYAVCRCGWHSEAPFGRLFHVHVEVCPQCGSPKDNMSIYTARRIKVVTKRSARSIWFIKWWRWTHETTEWVWQVKESYLGRDDEIKTYRRFKDMFRDPLDDDFDGWQTSLS